MKMLIVVAALASAVALYAPLEAVKAGSREFAGSGLTSVMTPAMLIRVADQETPTTEETPSADTGTKKSHKGGKKAPATAAPSAGAGAPAASGAGKKTPTTAAPTAGAAAAGAGKKSPTTPTTGTAAAKVPTKQAPATPAAAAAGAVKKGPATAPATAPAEAALPPGVPAGATKVPGSGGNAPSYLVPTANGTQTYIMDPRTGQYYNVTAATSQPAQ